MRKQLPCISNCAAAGDSSLSYRGSDNAAADRRRDARLRLRFGGKATGGPRRISRHDQRQPGRRGIGGIGSALHAIRIQSKETFDPQRASVRLSRQARPRLSAIFPITWNPSLLRQRTPFFAFESRHWIFLTCTIPVPALFDLFEQIAGLPDQLPHTTAYRNGFASVKPVL